MTDLSVSRTLVKSPPELWAELSDLERLTEHLGEFGEIAITRLDPESTVAWEGDSARGTVALEPTGWGTKVTLTAHPAEEPTVEIAPVEMPEGPPATVAGRRGWLRRWRRPVPAPAARPQLPRVPDPEPTSFNRQAAAVLSGALDALGAARHRPFSRG